MTNMPSMKKNQIFLIKKIKKWSEFEDSLIRSCSSRSRKRNWKELTRHLNGKTVMDCISRYKTICFCRGRWTDEEDRKLVQGFQKFGRNWSHISREMKTRNWKQIRDRYLNYLDPNVSNAPFTIDEDIRIYDLYGQIGSNWKYYTPYFSNRSADKIKNRYNSSIKGKENRIKLYKALAHSTSKKYVDELISDEENFLLI